MENIKDKIFMIIAIIVVLAVCALGYYFFEYYEEIYYTQIDNSKVTKLDSSDNMKYEYTLEAYNEKGNKKEIKFKTSRELREDAYLKLELKVLGVHAWEEVQENELPDKAQEKYK
ncbi:MAG: YxeA family protein [Clostridia bacterium]|nr:YxeA family protein [Clostridia bacterium]